MSLKRIEFQGPYEPTGPPESIGIKWKSEIRSKIKDVKKKQGHKVIDKRYTGKSYYHMVC